MPTAGGGLVFGGGDKYGVRSTAMRRFREQAEIATSALLRILAASGQVDARAVPDLIDHPKRERRLAAALQERAQGNAALFVHWRGALHARSAKSHHSAMSC